MFYLRALDVCVVCVLFEQAVRWDYRVNQLEHISFYLTNPTIGPSFITFYNLIPASGCFTRYSSEHQTLHSEMWTVVFQLRPLTGNRDKTFTVNP